MAKNDLPLDDEDIEESQEKSKKGKKEKKPKEKKEKPPKPAKEPKPKKEKPPKEPGRGKAILKKVLNTFFFLLFLGGISAFLFFNVFGVRQNYVIPQLRKIPIVKNMIPLLEGEQLEEVVDEENPDKDLSKKQLLEKIAMLEKQIDNMQEDINSKDEQIVSLNGQVDNLKQYESDYLAFLQKEEEFNQKIANGDPDAFAAYYEKVDPATAEKIYTEVIKKNEASAELSKYTATFQEMKAASAATVLEEMVRTDDDLVVTILQNVDAEQRAAILSAMSARNAAALTRRIIPAQ